MTLELEDSLVDVTKAFGRGNYFIPRQDTPKEITDKLLGKISSLRLNGPGGTGDELHYLILRQLLDFVAEAGSGPSDQTIDYNTSESIIHGRNPLFSAAQGSRPWGKSFQIPSGDYIERTAINDFLSKELPLDSIYTGSPEIAVLKGPSGAGKTTAAALYARSLSEHFGFIMLLDASSTESLSAQVPLLVQQLSADIQLTENPSNDLMNLLSESPVPWLLILDGADDPDALQPWIPVSGYGQVIITTTSENWPAPFGPSKWMDSFTAEETRDFFVMRLQQPEEQWSNEELKACDYISSSLASWPLAMEFASGWITQHGGFATAFLRFAERIQRLDLDNEHQVPHSYPHTAVQIIRSQWEELSIDAKFLLSWLLLMGGKRVPYRVLVDSLPEPNLGDAALEELRGFAFAQLQIADEHKPRILDQVLNVHDFVSLVVSRQGIETSAYDLPRLICTTDRWIRELMNDGKFLDGAALIRSTDHLLSCTVDSPHFTPENGPILSIAMHNLAQLALVTSNASIARKWAERALRARENTGRSAEKHGHACLQLQTLAVFALAISDQPGQEDIIRLSNYACTLVNDLAPGQGVDPQTQSAIFTLKQWIHSFAKSVSSGATEDALKALNGISVLSHTIPASTGNQILEALQYKASLATPLVRSGSWKAGVDITLQAAGQAFAQGILLDQIIDEILNVGLELMAQASSRGYMPHQPLKTQVGRLVEWIQANPVELSESQLQRFSILESYASNFEGFSAVLSKLPPHRERTEQLSAWIKLATTLKDCGNTENFDELWRSPPPGVELVRRLNEGTHLNIWWRSLDPPVLWVHAPEIEAVNENGPFDYFRREMSKAGLEEGSPSGPVTIANGWTVHFNEKDMSVLDADGREWVQVDELPDQFLRAIFVHKGLALIYGDFPTVSQSDLVLTGWIPLAPDSRSTRQQPKVRESSNRRWWKKILFWRLKY